MAERMFGSESVLDGRGAREYRHGAGSRSRHDAKMIEIQEVQPRLTIERLYNRVNGTNRWHGQREVRKRGNIGDQDILNGRQEVTTLFPYAQGLVSHPINSTICWKADPPPTLLVLVNTP